MLLYRVFPHLPSVEEDKPGHPLFVYPRQGAGRWDNPDLYLARYLGVGPEVAIGEAFAHLRSWRPEMLVRPDLPGSVRRLATYRFDEEDHPLLDLDDAQALLGRGIRPTDVVIRDRPKTQRIAADIFRDGRWAGIKSWSYHRPQWQVVTLWKAPNLGVVSVEDIAGHPALAEAADALPRASGGW